MNWTAFLNVILLIAALTTDSFVVSFSYGAQNVKMSMKMILVMNLVMSLLLAVILSLDGLAAGIGTGLLHAEEWLLIAGVFLGGILMMEAGWRAGNHFRHVFRKDISWISGICLLILGAGTLCKL